MGADLEVISGLSAKQREALRLEALGKTAKEIAADVSITQSTLSRWRADPVYHGAIHALHAEMDRDTVAKARAVRDEALAVVVMSIASIREALTPDEDGRYFAEHGSRARLAKAALDIYRSMSSQTGISERQEVKVTTEVDARTALDELCRAIRRE